MNRPIKFRIWDENNKKYLYDGFAILPNGNFIFYDINTGYWTDEIDFDWYKDKRFVLQQFTGFLDKNGKEIYEGDILGQKSEPYCDVVYSNGSFRMNDGKMVAKKDSGSILTQDRVNRFEILDNIFETPKLLKP